jgi:hypothetical protein
MARYIITQNQMHSVIYKYLDNMFDINSFKKEINPYNKNAYRIELSDNNGDNTITYFWFGPGEYDDETKHYGIGNIHIHPDIVDTLRQMITIRESKVMDIIADWFSEKFNEDIDEISIYPERRNPPVY